MKLLTFALFAALLTLVACEATCSGADPKNPKWPTAYSATVEWRANHRPHHTFFRVFWDEKHNRARSGSMVEWKGKQYKLEAIYLGDKSMAYYIFYDREEAKCYTMDLKNKTISGLDLDDADYQGTAVVEYHPVYHWEKILEEKGMKAHIRVFDTQDDREIKKLGYYVPDEGKAGTMTFHEVNYGPQANSLFKLPKLVKDHCNEKLEQVDIFDISDPVALLQQLSR